MSKFIIKGGERLSGTVNISGSKNAALPILFSLITMGGVSTLYNVPNIGDVDVALRILSSFGAKISRVGEKIKIDTNSLFPTCPKREDVSLIRASSYLLGATLARFGVAYIQPFGGCNFDSRPIDMHIYAAEALGATFDGEKLTANRLVGADIVFKKISVGATVNALILTANAEGVSRIFGYAKEPHIISFADFLRSAGAKITISDECITVVGAHLCGTDAVIIPDMIEAGTFLALSLLTKSDIKVIGATPSHLDSFLYSAADLGTVASILDSEISLLGTPIEYSEIKTSPYPGFPTDLAPQMAPLLASGEGGIIREGVFRNRFGYLSSLSPFGLEFELGDGFAKIKKSNIHSARTRATDLRGGAAAMMCALFASGESVIEDSIIIKRGYTDIVKKLTCIGADIKEI